MTRINASIDRAATASFNVNHRKDNHFSEQYTAFYIDEDLGMREIVTIRTYTTDSRVYACCWIEYDPDQIYLAGSGYAGGYGYHRASAAAEEALNNAGIQLSEHINGRGSIAISNAVEAVAVALTEGQYRVYVHRATA